MYQIIVILAVIVSVLLTLIVLVQESKGGGLAAPYAGAGEIMGVRKTTDVVEKTTWVLAALLVVLSVLTVYAKPQERDAATVAKEIKANPTLPGQKAATAPVAPVAPAQEAPAAE